MHIVIDVRGGMRCIYGEAIDLNALGDSSIVRASHVEPDQAGAWRADLSPVGGPTLGPFPSRSLALAAEADWLNANWLIPPPEHG